jgi:hypothetical protein
MSSCVLLIWNYIPKLELVKLFHIYPAIQTVGRRNWRSDLEPVGICISKGESTVLRRDI